MMQGGLFTTMIIKFPASDRRRSELDQLRPDDLVNNPRGKSGAAACMRRLLCPRATPMRYSSGWARADDTWSALPLVRASWKVPFYRGSKCANHPRQPVCRLARVRQPDSPGWEGTRLAALADSKGPYPLDFVCLPFSWPGWHGCGHYGQGLVAKGTKLEPGPRRD